MTDTGELLVPEVCDAVPDVLYENAYTLTPADEELLNLLNEHGLSDYFFLLQAAKIDVGCFKTITEKDITDIFKDEIGIRIRFRDLVNKWRASNKMAPVLSCSCEQASTSAGTVSRSDSLSSCSGSFSSSAYKFVHKNELP